MSLKVIREEEGDSGFSRQVTVIWTIARYRAIHGKVRAKQRLKSPAYRVMNVSGFDVDGSIVLFPKGIHPDRTEPLVGVELRHAPRDLAPSTKAELKVGKKRLPTPIAIEVECFTDNGVDEGDDLAVSLGASVEVEINKKTVVPQWAAGGGGGGSADYPSQEERNTESSSSQPLSNSNDDVVEVPHAFTEQQVLKVVSSLSLLVKITFLSHGDDVSDVSDDFGLLSEQREAVAGHEVHADGTGQEGGASSSGAGKLFSQVLTTGQGMLQNFLHDVAVSSPSTHHREGQARPGDDNQGDDPDAPEPPPREHRTVAEHMANAATSFVASDFFQRNSNAAASEADYSAEWQPLVELFCHSDVAPNEWRKLPAGCWAVFAHCICDLDHVFLHPASAWEEATIQWSRPSPASVATITDWCPPLRQKVIELVPHHTTYKNFWVGFFSALDACARLNPLTEGSALHRFLRRGSDAAVHHHASTSASEEATKTSAWNAMQLLNFVLLMSSPDSVDLTSLQQSEVEQQLEFLKRTLLSFTSLHSSLSITVEKEREVSATLEQISQRWRHEEAQRLTVHHDMVERAKTICEHGSWSLLARRTLATAGERGPHGITEVSDELAMVAQAAAELAACR